MKMIWRILLWIWQAPQNIVGLFLRLWYCKRVQQTVTYRDVTYYVVLDFAGAGLSLGETVIVRCGPFVDPNLYPHEYGHVLQSRYLGPLYLLVIGIPSLLWAIHYRIHKKGRYDDFFTERWADRLGGINRSLTKKQ